MKFDQDWMYQVKEVAERLNVSKQTIYRAIESGALDGLKIGTGRGTLRISGSALNTWLNSCSEAAYAAYVEGGESPEATDEPGTSDAAADGLACVVCGANFLETAVSHVPVGHSETGSQVFACVGRCEKVGTETAEVA